MPLSVYLANQLTYVYYLTLPYLTLYRTFLSTYPSIFPSIYLYIKICLYIYLSYLLSYLPTYLSTFSLIDIPRSICRFNYLAM